MPKVSIYLPNELYGAARAHGLCVSALAQQAVEQALRAAGTDRWVGQVRNRPARMTARVDTAAARDDAREEFGA